MKIGKTLSQLAAEIERQNTQKLDMVASTENISVEAAATPDVGRALTLHVGQDREFGINETAHRHIGQHVGIPANYYDRMRTEAPQLLATNINTWLKQKPAERMVRTLDGNVRAFMSDRYRPLENFDLMEAVLPAMLDRKLEIISCEVTERRLYIKAVDPRIVRKLNGNRVIDGKLVEFEDICPSLVVSNSEVGEGALAVNVGAYQHGCRNMSIFTERSLKKYHVGGKHELGEGLYAVLSDQTRKITDAATWSQVRDVVAAALDEAKFEKQVAAIQAMTSDKIESASVAIKVVENVAKRFSWTVDETDKVTTHLIEGASLTRFGLFNAITRAAEDFTSYDRATEFERKGGEIIDLTPNDWEEVVKAAA